MWAGLPWNRSSCFSCLQPFWSVTLTTDRQQIPIYLTNTEWCHLQCPACGPGWVCDCVKVDWYTANEFSFKKSCMPPVPWFIFFFSNVSGKCSQPNSDTVATFLCENVLSRIINIWIKQRGKSRSFFGKAPTLGQENIVPFLLSAQFSCESSEIKMYI